jgi:electron transport complex protein RnfE
MADQPTATERFIQGILPENPVYRQLLGLCPTLAVTNSLMAAVTMAGAVGFVLLCANVIISLIRNLLKPHLRIVVFTLTIATFVTIADRLLAAYLYQMSKTLGPYIPLIIVNCIIICRCEVVASKQSPWLPRRTPSARVWASDWRWPALPPSARYWGPDALFGLRVLPAVWPDWVIMVLPPGAFLTFGLLLGTVNWITARKDGKKLA